MAPMPMGFPQGRRRSDWLVGQLPVGMLDSDFFYRFASIFQEQSGTYLDAIDSLPNTIDPAVAPPPMVRFLAGWLALPPLRPSMNELDQRRTVMEMAKIRRWRGTKRGLTDLLALLTGGQVDISDRSGVFRTGTGGEHLPLVTIRVTSTGWLSEQDLIEVVLDEVPAHASMELFVGERKIWPMASAEHR
jgi:phage tail-like protein